MRTDCRAAEGGIGAEKIGGSSIFRLYLMEAPRGRLFRPPDSWLQASWRPLPAILHV